MKLKAKVALPDPIPALLTGAALLGDSDRPFRDLEGLLWTLGVKEATVRAWHKRGIPETQRKALARLCLRMDVHWERPEHGLWRTIMLMLAVSQTHQAFDAANSLLGARWRDFSLPSDRRYLALSLLCSLGEMRFGNPLTHIHYIPPEYRHIRVPKQIHEWQLDA